MSQTHTLTSFAIAGVGDLGLPIVQALAASTPRPSIVVLSRDTPKQKLPQGVKIAKVNYDQAQTIIDVLHEHRVEAVISTLPTKSIDVQYKLIDASKVAGVKIFAPSEFGLPSEGAKEGFLKKKFAVIEYQRSVGLPYTRFYAGGFIEWLPTILGLQTGKINLIQKEGAAISLTSIQDIAGFVAHALTTFPLSQLTNATFRLEGHRVTLSEVAKIFGKGGKEVEYVDTIPGESPDDSQFRTVIQRAYVSGMASTRWDWPAGRELTLVETKGENARELWPGHVWKRIEDVATGSV